MANMSEGWIKLHRRLAENKLWLDEPFTRGQAWVDLLMLANHRDGYVRKRGIRVSLKRGDVGWSHRNLAERWKWSRGKVKRFLDELENDHMIVPQNNNVTGCISIVNYEAYQNNSTTDSTTNGPQTVPQTVPEQERKEEIKKESDSARAREETYQPAERALAKVIANGSIQQVAKNANELFSLIETKAREEPEWWKTKIKDYCEIDQLTKQQRQDSIKLWANHLFTNNPADLWNWSKTEASLQKWLIRERIRATQA